LESSDRTGGSNDDTNAQTESVLEQPKKYPAGTPNAFESKTAVLDRTGVTLTGQMAQAMWRWAAMSRFTSEKELLLIWIGQSATVVIPRRSFGSDSGWDAAKAFIRARLSETRPA